VQAEEPEESKVTIKIAFNIITRQEDRNTGATQLTFDYDRQRQNETEGTKYTDESNINGVETGEPDDQNKEQVADEGVSSGEETKGSWEV